MLFEHQTVGIPNVLFQFVQRGALAKHSRHQRQTANVPLAVFPVLHAKAKSLGHTFSKTLLPLIGVIPEEMACDYVIPLDPEGALNFGPSINFPTTERIASITYKSAVPMGAIKMAGTHLVVQGTNKINGT